MISHQAHDSTATAPLRVVGIDAGGTKTMGLLADLDGNVLAKVRGGPANLRQQGELGVEKVIFQILEDLELDGPPAALCLGIAGAHLEGQNGLVRRMLRRLGVRRHVRVEHDAHIALVAGAPDGVGIVVASGTGSIAHGVDGNGTAARSGGWGYLLGDEGSAFWLGHAALRLGIRSADGRDRHTTLYRKICARLELTSAADLVAWFYDQDESRHRVARLAGLVEEAAAEGDGAATDLLDHAASHLARAAESVHRQLVFDHEFPVVLAGGAFRACPSLAARTIRSIGLEGAQVVQLDREPAEGAVRLALQSLATDSGSGGMPLVAPADSSESTTGETS